MSGPVSMASSQRAPTIAVATVALDGVPVEQMPELQVLASSLPQQAQDMVRENPKYLIAYNLYEILAKLPRDHVMELYSLFIEIEVEARKVGADEIKNS
jgi:hypothetical protein